MSRALFVNIPAHGHVNPTLPLVAELVARGEQVDYALTREFEGAVRREGARFVPYESTVPEALALVSSQSGPAKLPARILEEAMLVVPQLMDAVGGDPPDYIVYDPFCASGPVVAERLGVPGIQTNATYVFTEQTILDPGFRRIAEWAASAPPSDAFETASLAFAEQFGVTPPRVRDVFMRTAGLNIVFIPRSFQPGGDALDDRWAFVGPSAAHRHDAPSDDALDALASMATMKGRPLLYVSLGTVFNDQETFFRHCLEAFGNTDWQVLLAVGNRVDIDALGRVPPNALVLRSAPQLEVLKRARAFVSHGGMNSTMESILAGVPLVVVPQQPEQAVTAERVAALGLGAHLDPAAVTPDALAAAVARVAGDEGVAGRLAAMREEAVSGGGPQRAAEEILRHVG